jgi:hypothetical protein
MPDITITGKGFLVDCYRTGDPIVPSDGYGGHQATERPKNVSITDWDGRPPFKIQLPILLSKAGQSIEADRRTLEAAAIGKPSVSTTFSPVQIAGENLAFPPGSGGEGWFIEDIDRSGRERKRKGFVLIQKELVLTLLEKIKGNQVKEPTLSTTVAGRAVAAHYRVTKGDVGPHALQRIAARELGDSTLWPDIAVLNGLRSSPQVKVGMLLKLP